MKLSVLIPVYNAEKYISNCIESLIRQDIDKEDYEIVIMDDGSTDNSINIIEGYCSHNDNIVLYKEKNVGVYATRNKLLEKAKGDYIYFLDADDYIVDNCLRILIKTAIDNNVDVLAFNTKITDVLDFNNFDTPNDFEAKIIYGADFIINNENFRTEIWWYFIKKDFLSTNSIKFEKGLYCIDVLFTLEILLESNRMMHLPISVHRYVVVPNSIMHNNKQGHLKKLMVEYENVINKLDSFIKARPNTNDLVIKKMRFINSAIGYQLFHKFIKSNISITKINSIIKKFEKLNIYPLENLVTAHNKSIKFRISLFVFNNKTVFYIFLYPLRLLYKLNLIKLI